MNRNIFRILIVNCISVLLLAVNFSAAYSAPPQYQVIDLGTFGGTSSVGNGINNSGKIVGTKTNANGSTRAFMWDGTMHDLGTLGGASSWGRAINNLGVVVGETITANGQMHGFYHDGTIHDIGVVNGTTSSRATAISNNGLIVGYSNEYPSPTKAFVYNYNNGTLTDLSSIAGYGSASPYGINDNNTWVGGIRSGSGTGNQLPYRFTNNTLTLLPTLSTSIFSGRAHDINNSGKIVGVSHLSNGEYHAFLYNGTTTLDLGTLGGGTLQNISWANAINESNQVVGYSFAIHQFTPTTPLAFVYDSTNGMLNLNNLIPANSGWVLTDAKGINDHGWITGEGTINGQTHAFLLKPIPEPGTISLVILGGVGLLWQVRRKN